MRSFWCLLGAWLGTLAVAQDVSVAPNEQIPDFPSIDPADLINLLSLGPNRMPALLPNLAPSSEEQDAVYRAPPPSFPSPPSPTPPPFPLLLEREQKPVLALDQRHFEWIRYAAEFSAEAFEEFPQRPRDVRSRDFIVYNNGPDQTIFARYNGMCYVAFRGYDGVYGGLEDLWQVLNPGIRTECVRDSSDECCDFRSGWVEAFRTTYFPDLLQNIDDCYEACTNKDECLIVTGHSAGAAVIPAASVYLKAYHPFGISFGEPASVVLPCDYIETDRYIRIINTWSEEGSGLSYDWISGTPGLQGTHSVGHVFLISSFDTNSVAYLGSGDARITDNTCSNCHRMREEPGNGGVPGYRVIINDIYDKVVNEDLTPRTDGFEVSAPCNTAYECQSGLCEGGLCQKRTYPACAQCTEDSDCDSGTCVSGFLLVWILCGEPRLGSWCW